ncbi:GL14599 [Drosophila persimilis]|uniref:GL14599 n=1 Tax=Drosophila persimilis TaxID=7234 RepID=B4GVU9_DROPE|nr:GL14599 [Drosophila persimilis]
MTLLRATKSTLCLIQAPGNTNPRLHSSVEGSAANASDTNNETNSGHDNDYTIINYNKHNSKKKGRRA